MSANRNIQKPRILFLHQGGELYGSDIVFAHAVAALAQDTEPIVVLHNEGPLIEKLKPYTNRIIIHPLGVLRRKYYNPSGLINRGRQIIKASLFLARLIREENATLVYSNTIGVIPGALAAKLTKTPHVWHIHEIIVNPRLVGKLLAYNALLLSDKVIAVSQAVVDYLTGGKSSPRVAIIHNCVPVDKFQSQGVPDLRTEFGIPNDTLVIGVIGRIHPWKGQDFFLDVAAVIKQAGLTKFKLLIVGSPFQGNESLLEHLRKKTETLNLSQNVIFTGFRTDIDRVLSTIDILVVPSTQPDPFSLVTVEGMAAGKAIIATAHGGPKEMIEDGISGFLVPPNDVRQMADRVLQLAHDHSLRIKMGQRARERAWKLFAPERFNEKIRALVLELLKQRT